MLRSFDIIRSNNLIKPMVKSSIVQRDTIDTRPARTSARTSLCLLQTSSSRHVADTRCLPSIPTGRASASGCCRRPLQQFAVRCNCSTPPRPNQQVRSFSVRRYDGLHMIIHTQTRVTLKIPEPRSLRSNSISNSGRFLIIPMIFHEAFHVNLTIIP